MTYTITIDQEFAIRHELTLTQVASLAAFLSLPYRVNAIVQEGEVWYPYSDDGMARDFPLLFGVPKRCYKNLSELADKGFVVVNKVGKTKVVRFTSLCGAWNKEKSENGLNESEIGLKQSENGLNLEKEEKYTKEERDIYTKKEKIIEKKKIWTIEEKIEAFRASCERFIPKYGSELVAEFVNHYSQVGSNGLLLCEIKKKKDGAFDIGRRLATWASNDKKWHPERNMSPAPPTPSRPKKTPWEEMGLTKEQYIELFNK